MPREYVHELRRIAVNALHYDAEDARRRLGYNPAVLLCPVGTSANMPPGTPPDRRGDQKSITVYVHGFGDNAENFLNYCVGTGLVTNDSLFVDLPDAELRTKILALRKASFAQWSDIAPVLYVLKKCCDVGYTHVDLFGFSRGASVVLNMLDVLKNDTYKREQRRIGMDDETRKKITAMIEHGCITLDAPLKSMPQELLHLARNARREFANAIRKAIPYFGCHQHQSSPSPFPCRTNVVSRYVESAVRTMLQGTDHVVASWFNYVILPLVTRYRPWGQQAIISAERLEGLDLKFLINYEANDTVVTGWGNRRLYQTLLEHHPHTYCVRSNDGGHVAVRQNLPIILRAFKSRFGHTSVPLDVSEANKILAECHVTPENIEDC